MTRRQSDKHFKDLQRQIISKYRALNGSKSNSRFPTFLEFVEYILDVTQFLQTREDWLTQVSYTIKLLILCTVGYTQHIITKAFIFRFCFFAQIGRSIQLPTVLINHLTLSSNIRNRIGAGDLTGLSAMCVQQITTW